MAAINKSLAQSNKSQDVGRATKGCSTLGLWERQRLLPLSPRQNEALATSGWLGPHSFADQMNIITATDNLSLILRRLDEIERKLDRMLEELRTLTAIGYSVRRGNHPRKD